MTQMTSTEITEAVRSLPALPQIMSKSMIFAQGYKPTAAERAAIVARADFFTMMDMSRTVTIKVIDFTGMHIGNLEFNL